MYQFFWKNILHIYYFQYYWLIKIKFSCLLYSFYANQMEPKAKILLPYSNFTTKYHQRHITFEGNNFVAPAGPASRFANAAKIVDDSRLGGGCYTKPYHF